MSVSTVATIRIKYTHIKLYFNEDVILRSYTPSSNRLLEAIELGKLHPQIWTHAFWLVSLNTHVEFSMLLKVVMN